MYMNIIVIFMMMSLLIFIEKCRFLLCLRVALKEKGLVINQRVKDLGRNLHYHHLKLTARL